MFLKFRNRTLDELSCNSQKCHLQGFLNDKFDDHHRDIYIADMQRYEPVLIYQKKCNKPVPIYKREEGKPKLISRSTERFMNKGFIVFVPKDIWVLEETKNKLKSYVEKYKLVTTTYEVRAIERPGVTISYDKCSPKHKQWHKCELPIHCKFRTESWGEYELDNKCKKCSDCPFGWHEYEEKNEDEHKKKHKRKHTTI